MASFLDMSGSRLRAIPSGVWALGFVSLLMDTSSEMIHALLPVYLVTAMGASMLTVGVIEGVAEATAAITKIFSGALSDRLGKRKLLAALGYGLAAITKPVFPLAPSIEWLFAARFVDRIGKGLRGAPRDALVADLSPPELRGASFGLRQALDTVGAFLGPLLAIALMWLFNDNFKGVFWVAVIPAALCVALIIVAVREPARPQNLRQVKSPLSPAELARLGPACWWVIAIAGVFTLARFSEAFLILRATGLGLPLALTPAVLVVMNAVYALAAYPAEASPTAWTATPSLRRASSFSSSPTSCWPSAMASSVPHSASSCGACTWHSRKGCCRRLLPTPHRPSCAVPPSACSTLSAALPCSPPVSSPAASGT